MIQELEQVFAMVTGTQVKLTENIKIDSLGVNSLTKIQLICAIEEKYNIDIPNAKIKTFKTVKNVLDYLQSVL